MSEARMKPPAPVRMWAVIRVAHGGRAEAILGYTIRWHRADAIAAFDEIWVRPGEYARLRRRGRVRAARVIVSVEGKIVMTEPEREWVPDPRWKVTLAGGECSFPRCEGEAVAVFLRRYAGGLRRYRYCADHLYGRRIIDGVVCCSRRVSVEGVGS